MTTTSKQNPDPDDTPSRTTPTSRGTVRSSTDDSVRVVLISCQYAAKSSYHLSHHGDPACGVSPRVGEYIEWPAEKAQAWRDPCGFCFPDADEGADEDGESA